MRPALGAAWAGAFCLCLGACDAQVTSGYRGEKLLEIRGNVVAAGVAPAEAALLWWTPAGGAMTVPGTRVTTTGRFPAAFTLSVYRRPPGQAILDFASGGGSAAAVGGGPILRLPGLASGAAIECRAPAGGLAAAPAGRAALASIAAVRPGSADDALADNIIGLAEDFALIYLPGSAGGYRLMKVEWLPASAPDAFSCDGPAPFMRLRASDGGLDGTEIEIHIGAG